jgi:D-3-phosphoglycerate dehydrogenase / 2-oxoglutarate reductase
MPTVVIIASTFPNVDPERAILSPAGCDVVQGQPGPDTALMEQTRDADAVIVQFAPLNAAVIDNMHRAKAIVRYGVGYDNVDVEAARRRHIPVCNVPDYGIDEVADQALALLLALTRQILPNHNLIRGGGWGLAVRDQQMRTLREISTGVVGFGRIGRAVVQRLVAFGGRVLVADPHARSEAIRTAGAEPATLEALLAASDLVTLHCLLNDQTRHLLNAASLARMKPGVLLVNVSRGGLVDAEALQAALRSGQIGGAGLDVFETEPLPPDSPLRRLDNVVISSHIAAVSTHAIRVLRESAAKLALHAVRGEPLENVVNGVA